MMNSTLLCSLLAFVGFSAFAETRIVLASSGPGISAIAAFKETGGFFSLLADYTGGGDSVRGLALLDRSNLLVTLDGIDRVDRISSAGVVATGHIIDSNVSGNLSQLRQSPVTRNVAIIENNNVEMFDPAGIRIGNPAIPTVVGSCVLNMPRSLAFAANGDLFVVGTGNDRVTQYRFDNSGNVSCVASSTVLNSLDPATVLFHTNGKLYVGTHTDDRIYEFDSADLSLSPRVIWETNLIRIGNPTAMAEMPDGSILVASDQTNSLERIVPHTGAIDTVSFMRNLFTGYVADILVADW